MKNNKAPGPDGISIEFFKAFFGKSNLSDNQNDSSVDDDKYSSLLLIELLNMPLNINLLDMNNLNLEIKKNA